MTTGDRLKELRQKANLTLQDAGELIGTSKQNLFKYENDIITNIPIDRLVKLAEIYNTSPIEILGWEHFSNNPNLTKVSVYNYLPYGVSAGSPDGPNYEVDLEKIEISDSVMGPYANDDNVKVFKDLQLYESVGLIEPVGADHMYFAAMNSKSCKLTLLGLHYWKLSKDKRF